MTGRIARIVLLVEDQNHENLLRHFLKRLGHGNREIRIEKLPRGQGSGEQFVRGKYASEVRAVRSQMTRTHACLIAMIDADNATVQDRAQQFERALRDADEEQRRPAEPILHLIPKRNVETWILCLMCEIVNENEDYRRDGRIAPGSISLAANALFEWSRPNTAVPGKCVESLRASLPEFRRIPALER